MKESRNHQQASVSGEVIEKKQHREASKRKCKDIFVQHKRLWLILTLVGVALAGVSILLYFLLSPSVTVVHMTTINMPDSSQFAMGTLRLQDINLFQPSEKETAYVVFSVEESRRRLLQGSNPSYYVHFFNQETGINIRTNPQSSTFFVKEETFLSFAEKEYEKLDDKEKNNASSGSNKTIAQNQEYFSDLGTIFTQAIQKSGTPDVEVKFVNQPMVNLNINAGFLQFDFASKRKLQQSRSRKLFLAGLLKVATSIVPKVAGFVLNTVRKYGPIIGKVVGGVVGGVGGFFTGGPIGAFQGAMTGMEIGGMIGGVASSLVNACIPQGSFRISCSPSSIGSAVSQFGYSGSSQNLLPSSQGSSFGFGSFFGGIGGNFGNMVGGFINSIPQAALSNFGFGSLFGKR